MPNAIRWTWMVLLALALVGCGDDDRSSGSGSAHAATGGGGRADPAVWLATATESAEQVEKPADRAAAFAAIGRTWAQVGNATAADEAFKKAQAAAETVEPADDRADAQLAIADAQAWGLMWKASAATLDVARVSAHKAGKEKAAKLLRVCELRANIARRMHEAGEDPGSLIVDAAADALDIDSGTTVHALTAIADAQGGWDDRRARETLSDASKQAGRITDPADRARAFGRIAEVQIKLGHTTGVGVSLAQMEAALNRTEKLLPKELSSLAQMWAKRGEINKARAVADALVKRGNQEPRDDSAPLGRHFGISMPIKTAYTAIVRAQAESGDYAGAMKTTATTSAMDPGAYCMISGIALEQGNKEASAAAIEAARRYALEPLNSGDLPGAVLLLGQVAGRQIGYGDRAGGLKTFQGAKKLISASRDPSHKARALVKLAEAEAGAGLVTDTYGQARKAIDDLPEAQRDRARKDLDRSYATHQDEIAAAHARSSAEAARAFAEKIEDPDHRSQAWRSIALVQHKAGEHEAAAESRVRAFEAAGQIKNKAAAEKATRWIGRWDMAPHATPAGRTLEVLDKWLQTLDDHKLRCDVAASVAASLARHQSSSAAALRQDSPPAVAAATPSVPVTPAAQSVPRPTASARRPAADARAVDAPIEALRAKASKAGPLTPALVEKLAAYLPFADLNDPADRELHDTVTKFTTGQISIAVFAPYLRSATATLGQRAQERLFQAAESGDPWAAAFLARAHLTRDANSAFLPDFEYYAAPEEARRYYGLARIIVTDYPSSPAAIDVAARHVMLALSTSLIHEKSSKADARAQAMYGLFNASGPFGLAPDPEGGVRQYERAAKLGDPLAKAELGRCLLFGVGGEKDEARGARLIRESADAGHGAGVLLYGYINQHGLGVKKDPALAVRCFRRAMALGSSGARAQLGHCHLTGAGVEKDPQKGLALLEEAATRYDDGYAATMLGVMYYNGDPLPRDREQAVRWFTRGAEHRSVESLRMLGRCHASGDGVEQDHGKALSYMRRYAEEKVTRAESEQFNLDYRRAKWISEGELYSKLPGVRIAPVDVDNAMVDWLNETRAYQLAASVAARHGLKVDGKSPFTLRIRVGGTMTQDRPWNSIGVMARIETLTPVQRDDIGFIGLRVGLAEASTYAAGQVRLSRRTVDNLFSEQLASCLDSIRSRNKAESKVSKEWWERVQWDEKQNLEMARAYAKARAFGGALDKFWAQDIKAYRSYWVTHEGLDRADQVISRAHLDKMWSDAWAKSPRKKDGKSPLYVKHWLSGMRYSKPPHMLTRFYYTMTGHTQVRQSQVVFKLGDERRRVSAGVVHSDYILATCNAEKAGSTARQLVEHATDVAY